ncbi:MAG TPA: hypothetical protein VKV77_01630 [Methylovirgula sp.]|nr:hypothetical protein [Methylovirgula sp.]
MANQQGTGKHGHKDSQEPWPHQQGQSEGRGESQRSHGSHERKSASGGEDRSLKGREYRDEQGNVHHHTKTYEEQHGKGKE